MGIVSVKIITKKTALALAVVCACIVGIATAAEASVLSGRCEANGDYSNINFKDDGTIVKIGRLKFKSVKRNEHKISGAAYDGQYIWSFRIYDQKDLKLNIRHSPTSRYEAFSGSVRTNWGYTCRLRVDTGFQKNDLLSSSNGSVVFTNKYGGIRINSHEVWFDAIRNDVRAGETLSFGILGFEEKPNIDELKEDNFNLHQVKTTVSYTHNKLQLNTNIKKAVLSLPQRQWYVVYVKTSGGNVGWMRLRRAR